MNRRLHEVRNSLGLNQEDFGKRVELSKASISALENGTREITDRTVKLVCNEFNISEEWLRYGTGEMVVQSETFTLDEYAKKMNLTSLELDIIKSYMELDSDIRQRLIAHFKSRFTEKR